MIGRTTQRELSCAFNEEAVDLYRRGWSVPDIADWLGLTRKGAQTRIDRTATPEDRAARAESKRQMRQGKQRDTRT